MKVRSGMKVGVLYGGLSAEREVSLLSGRAVGMALQERGYLVTLIDVERDIAARLRQAEIDVAFIALHGRYGEDGAIQGVLEYLAIPYTGPGILGSSLAMDKVMSKRLLQAHGIPTPGFTLAPEDDSQEIDVPAGGYPLVVKPAAEGSSLGMSIVCDAEELPAALAAARCYSSRILIENYIPGTELTAALLDGIDLPLIEIRARGGLYDYRAKYTKGFTEYLVPAPLPAETTEKVLEMAQATARALACTRGAVRVDFRLDGNHQPFVIELNTVPGLTETSLLPKAAAAAGIDFNALIEIMLQGASLDLQA